MHPMVLTTPDVLLTASPLRDANGVLSELGSGQIVGAAVPQP